jgi:hypothetical protein
LSSSGSSVNANLLKRDPVGAPLDAFELKRVKRVLRGSSGQPARIFPKNL